VRASSEAEPHPRGRPALERGGTSPEGAFSPRARRNLTRGVTSPRARWGFVRAVPCPSSEAEFRPRGPGLTVLVGRWGRQVRGPLPLGRDCVCLCFVSLFALFCERNGFSPGRLGDP
jgi:hypothetical protein